MGKCKNSFFLFYYTQERKNNLNALSSETPHLSIQTFPAGKKKGLIKLNVSYFQNSRKACVSKTLYNTECEICYYEGRKIKYYFYLFYS